MAQPFKSQLIPASMPSVNTAIVLAFLTIAGFLYSQSDRIFQFFERLQFDTLDVANHAIHQFTQF